MLEFVGAQFAINWLEYAIQEGKEGTTTFLRHCNLLIIREGVRWHIRYLLSWKGGVCHFQLVRSATRQWYLGSYLKISQPDPRQIKQIMRQSDRRSSIDRINTRYSRPGNSSLSIRQPGSSFFQPAFQNSQRFSSVPPLAIDSQPQLASQVILPQDIQSSKRVRFQSVGSLDSYAPPGASVRYSNTIPPGAIPASQLQAGIPQGSIARYPSNQSYQSINPIQTRQTLQAPPQQLIQTYGLALPTQVSGYPSNQPVQPQTTFQERQTTIISQPAQPGCHDVSQVIPVNVVGTPQMGVSVLRNSAMRVSNPMYMVDNQYLQRPPNLSYIDNQTSTCPVWVWGLLGTLALVGIILTLVFVGKRDSGGYKITKAQTTEPSTAWNTTQTNVTKVQTPPQQVVNKTIVVNQTTQTPPPVNQTVATPPIVPPVVPVIVPGVSTLDDPVYKEQLIKQQNSTIVNQQIELDNLKNQLEALKNQKRLAAQLPPVIQPITTPNPPSTSIEGVITNPSAVSAPPQPQLPKPAAVDITECEAGYYPYGGICFPCKTGYWNGTNCIQNKVQDKPIQPSPGPAISNPAEPNQGSEQIRCGENEVLKDGRCISCPEGSSWNGKSCNKKARAQQKEELDNEVCPPGQFLIAGRCSSCPQGLFWDGKGCFQKPLRRKHLAR